MVGTRWLMHWTIDIYLRVCISTVMPVMLVMVPPDGYEFIVTHSTSLPSPRTRVLTVTETHSLQEFLCSLHAKNP